MPSLQQQENPNDPNQLWDLEAIREAAAEGIEEAEILLFAQAEQIASRGARIMRKMAILSYQHRRNKRALAIFTFEWGISAGNMARAVVRHREWFTFDRNASVQEMRTLFVLGQLNANADKKFYEYWREHQTMQPWEMQRLVSAYKKKSAKPKPKRIRMHARALHVDLEGKMASFELVTEDKDPVVDVVEGAGYKVNLSPDGLAPRGAT